MKNGFLLQTGIKKFLPRICCLLVCSIFLFLSGSAENRDTTSQQVSLRGFTGTQLQGGPVSYYIDSSGQSEINRIRHTSFQTSFSAFLSCFNKSPTQNNFWIKFRIANLTDSSLQVYLNCGKNISYSDLFMISDSVPLQFVQGGLLHRFPSDLSILQQQTQTSLFILKPHQQGELFLKLVQKTETFSFDGIYLYSLEGLYQRIGERSISHQHFIIFPLLFQGILICQLLYVLSQWLITRRKEYAYYLFYLLVIATYFLSMYEFSFKIRFLFARFPTLSIYLNKTLLLLPYFFYFRFIRSFLEMPRYYPVMNKWIIRIEYFLLAYILFNLTFISITLNLKFERELFTYVLMILFTTSAGFMIYLMGEKKTLIYFIISGSFFVGLGNIVGLVLDYLADEKITRQFPDTLIFSQIGILLEIFCFTAGLSYKSMSAEKEKIKSQENLIAQLKANELLQTKMQNIRNTIAQDLHDDIGSTLSSISILSNLALKEKNADQTMSAMHEIKDSSVTLMEKMDDIVWSINPRNDSLQNLLSRIRRFATTLFEAKNIDYTIKIQDHLHELNLPIEWRQHIYLILKEAINNLVKYAEATNASLEIRYQQGILEILLKDNGKGFDNTRPSSGNGLLSMRRRAEEMQALLEIQSLNGEGCQVILKLKIK